jgi:small subunit ribosomal protein S18
MSKPMMRSRRKKVSKLTRSDVDFVDYKDVELLKQYIDTRGKILPRRISGNSARHQRMITTAIKRARYAALLPYVIE